MWKEYTMVAISEEDQIKLDLIEEARGKYKKVFPLWNDWKLSTTKMDDSIILWFNDETGSTHVLKKEVKNGI